MINSAFLVGAPSSGTGKTTVTLAILRALRNRKLSVQAFKSGPDYIDPKFHELATDFPSVNLDMFFCDNEEVKSVFQYYSIDKEVSVVEGVMGLFDGYDKMRGSSADLARTLKIPVVLVVNGKGSAYSIAPLLYGYKNFDKSIPIAGVIFNNVRTETHYAILKESAESVGIPSFGYIPHRADLTVPSRHLGLSIDEQDCFSDLADKLAIHIENYVDIDLLLEKTKKKSIVLPCMELSKPKKEIKIAIAKDEVFSFFYYENLRKLREVGELVFFSPLNDSAVPKVDYLFLPGGYPEFFLEKLSGNTQMKKSIKEFAEKGGKIWAECGGMMYLCKEMIDNEGNSFSLANLFDLQATMQQMKLTLGYRQFTYNGIDFKGHEFHYSSLLPNERQSVCPIYNAKNGEVNTKLFRYKNVLAGYTHIYLHKGEDFLRLFD